MGWIGEEDLVEELRTTSVVVTFSKLLGLYSSLTSLEIDSNRLAPHDRWIDRDASSYLTSFRCDDLAVHQHQHAIFVFGPLLPSLIILLDSLSISISTSAYLRTCRPRTANSPGKNAHLHRLLPNSPPKKPRPIVVPPLLRRMITPRPRRRHNLLPGNARLHRPSL